MQKKVSKATQKKKRKKKETKPQTADGDDSKGIAAFVCVV